MRGHWHDVSDLGDIIAAWGIGTMLGVFAVIMFEDGMFWDDFYFRLYLFVGCMCITWPMVERCFSPIIDVAFKRASE